MEEVHNVGFTGEVEAGFLAKGKVGLEAGVTNGFSKTFTDSYSISESTTITATDKTSVIVNRTPVMFYVYDIQDNKTKKWVEGGYMVSVPLSPVMFSLSIEEYNKLVDKYNAKVPEGAPLLNKIE